MTKRRLLSTLLLSLFCCVSLTLKADILPTLRDNGWVSYHAGYRGSGVEIAVNTAGDVKLFITPRKNQRINPSWPVETGIRIERRVKGSDNWVQRRVSPNGFTPKGEVKLNQDNIEFTATVTGGAMYKVKIDFDKSGINIEAEMANTPEDADSADYRLVLEGAMPNLLSTASKYDDKELKSKTKGDYVTLSYKKERDEKIPISETKDITEINKKHPMSITLKADKIGRKKLTWKILNPKDKGALNIDFKSEQNKFIGGYNIRTVIIDGNGERLIHGIRLEYK